MEHLAEHSPDEAIRERAAHCGKRYKYPVDSQILAPNGDLLSQVGANEIMGLDLGNRYWRFLESAYE